MSVREFRSPDGRRWRVWAVQPGSMIGERRGRMDRRVTPVETLADPPVLQRRHGPDRRAAERGRSRIRASELLPDRWRDGWLVFDEDLPGHAAERETRRLAPIPPDWESCTEAELARKLEDAVVRSRSPES